MDYLCQVDAQLTAEAGNALCESHKADAEIESAKELAGTANQMRIIIAKLNEMRQSDFRYDYREPQKQPITTTAEE
jgi:hypothetical protein